MRTLKRILTAPLVFVAAVIILLEDWLWDDLQRLAQWLGHLPIFRQIEALIVRLPPTGALFIFIVPSLVLIPIKLVALYFISSGHALLGVSTVIAAKIAGTALVARLFKLTKPKLLRFRWFSWVYEHISEFRRRIYNVIQSSAAYRLIRDRARKIGHWFKRWRAHRRSWFRRRFSAARILMRRRREKKPLT